MPLQRVADGVWQEEQKVEMNTYFLLITIQEFTVINLSIYLYYNLIVNLLTCHVPNLNNHGFQYNEYARL